MDRPNSSFAMTLAGSSRASPRPSSFARSTGNSTPGPSKPRRSAFQDDSDDEADEPRVRDESLTGYDRNGAQRVRERTPPTGPCVIPLTANLDWREDRKRRLGLGRRANELGSLTSMRARGKEGSGPAPPPRDSELHSQGAQGPEKINAEEQKRGLDLRRREKARAEEEAEALERLQAVASAGDGQDEASADGDADKTPPASRAGRSPSSGETDDQAAIRALLAGEGMSSSSAAREDLTIGLPSEDDLLRADVDTRPEAPSLADYAATPVEHFGAALLRGMGWREGMGAGRKRNGPQSAPEPKKRAELLGLGAKERLVENGGQQTKGKGKKGFKVERPERRYVPVIKKDNGREESGRSGSSNALISRTASPSASRPRSPESGNRRRRDDERERERERDRDRRSSRRYDDEDDERERERERERSDRKKRYAVDDHERERENERDRDVNRYRDRDGYGRESDRPRGGTREKDRNRDSGRDREYDRSDRYYRDKEKEREKERDYRDTGDSRDSRDSRDRRRDDRRERY